MKVTEYGPSCPAESVPIDYALLAGFVISMVLSTYVAFAVQAGDERHQSELMMPAARSFVLLLCSSDISLCVLSLVQWALAHSGHCSFADDVYPALSSLEMVVQLLAFASASGVAAVVGRAFLQRSTQDNDVVPSPWRAPRSVLAVACTLPGAAHLILCSLDGSRCPSQCGYSSSKTAPGERLKRANELAGALLVFCATVFAASCALRARRAPRAVRHRLVHRLARYLVAFVALWGAVVVAGLADGAGPGCVWAWLLALQGYQGALNALLLAPQAAAAGGVPPLGRLARCTSLCSSALCCCCCGCCGDSCVVAPPLGRFVAFSGPGVDRDTPPERGSRDARASSLRASRVRAALAHVLGSCSGGMSGGGSMSGGGGSRSGSVVASGCGYTYDESDPAEGLLAPAAAPVSAPAAAEG